MTKPTRWGLTYEAIRPPISTKKVKYVSSIDGFVRQRTPEPRSPLIDVPEGIPRLIALMQIGEWIWVTPEKERVARHYVRLVTRDVAAELNISLKFTYAHDRATGALKITRVPLIPLSPPLIWQFSEMQVGDRVTYEGGTLAAERAFGAARVQALRMRDTTGKPFKLSYYRNRANGDVQITRTA